VHYGVGGSRRHYHRVTDDLDGIAFAALAARTRHVAALLLQIADRPARLPFSWVHPPDAGITGVALSPAEVGSLALGPDRGGVKITAVAPGLPAERSGLRAGDVVIAVGGKPVARESAAVRIIGQAFSALDRDGSLQLSVVRKGETVQVELRARASMP
jgi:S1-C subfamily serine protease